MTLSADEYAADKPTSLFTSPTKYTSKFRARLSRTAVLTFLAHDIFIVIFFRFRCDSATSSQRVDSWFSVLYIRRTEKGEGSLSTKIVATRVQRWGKAATHLLRPFGNEMLRTRVARAPLNATSIHRHFCVSSVREHCFSISEVKLCS